MKNTISKGWLSLLIVMGILIKNSGKNEYVL